MAKGVTIESLAQRIAELESRPRSLNEDFQLEAYRELLSLKVTYPGIWGYPAATTNPAKK